MKFELNINCGYLNDSDYEKEHLIRFNYVLKNMNENFKLKENHSITIVEFGYENNGKLEKFIKDRLTKINYKYCFYKFPPGEFFNQAKIRNYTTEISDADFFIYSQSDIILTNNVFDVFEKRFKDNTFFCGGRHDYSGKNYDSIINTINQQNEKMQIVIKDPSITILKKCEYAVKSNIRLAMYPEMIYDFQYGTVIFGDLMAYSKKLWKCCPYDENASLTNDILTRDRMLLLENVNVEYVHDEIIAVQFIGSDYMGETKIGHFKNQHLKEELVYIVEKYPELFYNVVFNYRKEYDDLLKNIPKEKIKEIYETYMKGDIRYPLYQQDAQHFLNTYVKI